MFWSHDLNRRDVMRNGGLGLGLLGAQIIAPRLHAEAAAAPLPISVVNTSGAASLIINVLAKRMKVLEAQGLQPSFVNVNDGTKIMGALISGSEDVCVGSGFGQVLPAIERGASLKIIAAACLKPLQAMFSSRPYIRSVKDLEGHTVGVGSPGALLYQLVMTLLRKQGVDLSKIQFANFGSSEDILRAVMAGTVDAGPSDVNVYQMQNELKIHSLAGGDMFRELPDFTLQATYASESTIKDKREALIRTLAAYGKLYRYIQGPDSRDAFVSAYAAAVGHKEGRYGESMWKFYQKNKPLAVNLLLSDERINYIQDLNLKFGVQKARLPVDKIADMSLAKEALARLG